MLGMAVRLVSGLAEGRPSRVLLVIGPGADLAQAFAGYFGWELEVAGTLRCVAAFYKHHVVLGSVTLLPIEFNVALSFAE